MKVFDVLVAFVALCLLLLAAIALRDRLRILRRLGIPEALVAGILGLAVGPLSPLRIFPDSVYSIWAQTPAVLISLVFATLFLGQTLPDPRTLWRRAASQTAFGMVLGWGQYVVGGLAVLLILQPLLGTDPLLAVLIEVGFEGGHGTAAGMGPTFTQLGLPSGEALGLAMATIGVLSAVLIGSTLVVIGRHRQWLPGPEDPSRTASGTLAADPYAASQRLAMERAAGFVEASDQSGSAPSATIDSLTVNLALAGGGIGLGVLLKHGLTESAAGIGGTDAARLFAALPLFPLAMVGGLIVQLLLQRFGRSQLASATVQASVGSLAMDLLITAAMASLNLPLIRDTWLPLVVLAVLGLAWNVSMFLVLAPRLFADAWFERGIADFGQSVGVTATGLLLLRMADPYGRSRALEPFSFKQLLFEPFLGGGLVTAFAPIAIAGWGLIPWTILSLAITIGWVLFGLALARRRR